MLDMFESFDRLYLAKVGEPSSKSDRRVSVDEEMKARVMEGHTVYCSEKSSLSGMTGPCCGYDV